MSAFEPLMTPLALSRRGFLKLGGSFTLGALFRRRRASVLQDSPLYGRVAEYKVDLYDTPSFKGNKLKNFWKDDLLNIQGATVGDEEPAYNRSWYQIGEEGYVHSGVIQPVRTILNEIQAEIPANGALGEITVPYTDAREEPGKDKPVVYRFYYETTYWVTKLIYDESGLPWYAVFDDKKKVDQFVPASHLRIIPLNDIIPISPLVPRKFKRIEVNIPNQVVIAYEYDRPVFMARAATGARFSTGDYYTPEGRHEVTYKRATRHMAAGDIASNGFDLPGVPWISYITENGVAIHGTYWHNDYGKPRSHGCVNLTPQASRWIYRWTTPVIPPNEVGGFDFTGTVVDVIY